MERRETHRRHRQESSNSKRQENEKQNEGRSQNESKVERFHHPDHHQRTDTQEKSKVNKGRRNVDDLQNSSTMPPTHHAVTQNLTEGKFKHSEAEEEQPPRPSYIPSETATSLEDKCKRIEKWRQDGALSLAKKEHAEALCKALYTRCHDARTSLGTPMSSCPSDKSRHYENKLRRVSHVSRKSPPTSTHEESISAELKTKELILEFMNKSLSKSISTRQSETINAKMESSETLNLPSASSAGIRQTVKSTPSVESTMKRSKLSAVIDTSSNNKPKVKVVSKVSDGATATKSQAAPSTIYELKKLDLRSDRSTLKIMNLPLSITLNDLKSLFPQSRSVTIPMYQFSNASEMSLGKEAANPTAFVKFRTTEDAEEVLSRFQGLKIRGHELRISVANKHRQGQE